MPRVPLSLADVLQICVHRWSLIYIGSQVLDGVRFGNTAECSGKVLSAGVCFRVKVTGAFMYNRNWWSLNLCLWYSWGHCSFIKFLSVYHHFLSVLWDNLLFMLLFAMRSHSQRVLPTVFGDDVIESLAQVEDASLSFLSIVQDICQSPRIILWAVSHNSWFFKPVLVLKL